MSAGKWQQKEYETVRRKDVYPMMEQHNCENVFIDTSLCCGEGPLWEVESGRVLFVDSDRTFVYSASADGKELEILSDDVQVSSVAFAESGYVLLGDGMWLMDKTGKKTKLLDTWQGERLFFNDSVVDPKGRIYAGTYYWGADGMEKTGKLFRLEKDREPVVLDEGIELSNGLGFSPEYDRLYYSDSAKKTIFCYDFDLESGTIQNKRAFFRSEIGIPDGLTCDSEGYVWCAMWYESAVYRIAPDGTVDRIYQFPAKQVSSVTFGGAEMDTLYVTSAAALFESPMLPESFDKTAYMGGKLFAVKTGVKGRTEHTAAF